MDVNTLSWLSWIIVGVAGAFIGSYLLSLAGQLGVRGFNIATVLGEFVGALVLLTIGRLLVGTFRAAY